MLLVLFYIEDLKDFVIGSIRASDRLELELPGMVPAFLAFHDTALQWPLCLSGTVHETWVTSLSARSGPWEETPKAVIEPCAFAERSRQACSFPIGQ